MDWRRGAQKAMERRGLTPYAVAQRMGWKDEGRLYKLLNDTPRNPGVDTLLLLAEAMGCSPAEFFLPSNRPAIVHDCWDTLGMGALRGIDFEMDEGHRLILEVHQELRRLGLASAFAKLLPVLMEIVEASPRGKRMAGSLAGFLSKVRSGPKPTKPPQ